jgi:RHS repeat-associated protein
MTATTYNSSNQVVTTNANTTGTLTYDIAGNVINDGVNNYVYDPDGRICAVQNLTSLAAWQYVYDAEGRRVGKGTINTWPGTGTGATCAAPTTANGFTLTNIYLRGESGDQDTELDGSDDWIHTNIFAGGGLTATYWNNNGTQELSYIYSDWLSTKRAQFDSTGTLQTYWQSDPFGDYMTTHGTGGDASELHFTGKERDTESGNDYFGARYYASSMGRFMSPDPVFATVDRIADPQQWNMYAYAGNNPLMNTDPSGLDFNLTCSGGNTATCQGGLQGQTTTDANGKSTFTATDVDMNDPKDAGAGYHDQFGNQYTGSFDQNSGVSFTNTATGDTSSNSRFIDGSDRTDVNGSGAFNGIQGQFNSNCGGSCEAKGSLYNLPGHDGAVAALEKMIGKSFEDNLNFFGGHGKANNYRFGDGQLTHIVDHLDGKNKGKQEIHFEGHAPGSNLQNFVLHQVDAIRDSANHQSAQEPNLP